jgi:hypothetical protein
MGVNDPITASPKELEMEIESIRHWMAALPKNVSHIIRIVRDPIYEVGQAAT